MNKYIFSDGIIIAVLSLCISSCSAETKILEETELTSPILRYEVVEIHDSAIVQFIVGDIYIQRKNAGEYKKLGIAESVYDKDIISVLENSGVTLKSGGGLINLTAKDKSIQYLVEIVPNSTK